MIANEIAFGKNFGENILYNVQGKAAEPNPHKTEWYVAKNIFTDDLEAAGKIMEATASASKATKPVYHFSIDWDRSEERFLNKDKCIEAADKIMEDIGLKDHQALYFWHVDADHPHMHVVANRVDENTGKAWDMWKSKENLERATQQVAKEMDFMQVPGKFNEMEFEVDKNKGASQSRQEKATSADLSPWNKENVADVKQEVGQVFYQANSWQDLNDSLEKSGYELQQKGQGFIVTDGTNYTQLSKMGKHVRMPDLEQKFGEKYAEFLANDVLEPLREDSPSWAFDNVDERLETQVQDSIKEWDNKNRMSGTNPSADVRTSEMVSVMQGLDKFESKWQQFDAVSDIKKIEARVYKQRRSVSRARELLTLHKKKSWELILTIDKALPEDKSIKSLAKVSKKIDKLYKRKSRPKTPIANEILKQLKKRRKKLIDLRKKRVKALKTRKETAKKKAAQLEKKVMYRLQKTHEAQIRLSNRKSDLNRNMAKLASKKLAHMRNTKTHEQVKNRYRGLLASMPKEALLSANVSRQEKAKLLTQWHEVQERNKIKQKEKDRGLEASPYDIER